jgi:beta-lactamase class A
MADISDTKIKRSFYSRCFAAVFFCLGAAAGFFLRQGKIIVQPTVTIGQPIRAGGYQFINPLLDFDSPQSTFVELKPFKDKIVTLTNQAYIGSDNVDFVSVYFRDLNNGPWFGVNEQASFTPASLLKVPLMMAYYKISESDPLVLLKQISVNAQDMQPIVPNEQTISPSVRLEVGKSYSADELISHMIIYSDNDAAQLLIANIDPKRLVQIYNDFGIELPNAEAAGTQVDVKTYAGFFRILFNASYLNRNDSEKALKLLSQVEFKEGLVAGVPSNITVAHKFGERVGEGNQRQLHDCGIVYYPNHPYLICVMSRGNDIEDLVKAISDISKQIYQEVDMQYNQK